jgi:hypothetical protein
MSDRDSIVLTNPSKAKLVVLEDRKSEDREREGKESEAGSWEDRKLEYREGNPEPSRATRPAPATRPPQR